MSRYLRKQMAARDLASLTNQPPVCDFCALHAPQWMYAASQTQGGVKVECWRWCACPDCADRVERQDWAALIRAIEEMMHAKLPMIPRLMCRQAADRALGDLHAYGLPARPQDATRGA